MVESGQPPIVPVAFASRRHPELPVEVLERRDVFAFIGRGRLVRPERLAFDELLLIRGEGGVHTVDFEAIPARAGRLIWIRAGQVQAWDTSSDVEATLVLSRPATSTRSPWFPGDRAWRDLDHDALALAESLIGGLRATQATFTGSGPEQRLMVRLFDALTALFDVASSDRVATRLPVAYVAFRDALEADLGQSHDVGSYAQRLGYSARTLSRACQRATGQTAKAVLDDRLLLEAKRLLVHTDLPASDIAAELGFSEATNFGKFFARLEGTSPGAFRRAQR